MVDQGATLAVYHEAGLAGLIGDHRVDAVRSIDTQDIGIQCQEVAHAIAPRQIDPHIPHQHVAIGSLKNRGQRPPQFVAMGEANVEIDKLTR